MKTESQLMVEENAALHDEIERLRREIKAAKELLESIRPGTGSNTERALRRLDAALDNSPTHPIKENQ